MRVRKLHAHAHELKTEIKSTIPIFRVFMCTHAQDFVIFKKHEGLRIFGEVFVDLRPEGCPNPPEGCPKPLGGPPYRALPIGALPIGPIGPNGGV